MNTNNRNYLLSNLHKANELIMKKLNALLLTLICAGAAYAQDPLVQTNYTADPAPMVDRDTVYLYTSHDEDDATGFKMFNWMLYTSTDMVNWTDNGHIANLGSFSWFKRDNGAWAIQVVRRGNKYYLYAPLHGNGIGVLVSDSPYGPFHDPLGHPLVWQREHWNDIDPTVFIDNDGQAYMYWGNPELYMVKLNEDMISYSGQIYQFPKIKDYQEGPWFWRRSDNYYLAFASTCCPEGIGYAMSKNPMGPWDYKGHVMDHTERTRGNHPGIIDYKGKSYVFGQNSDLLKIETNTYMERRSVSAAQMHYRENGEIMEVPYWKENTLLQIEPLNPYRRIEAETIGWGYGLKTKRKGDVELCTADNHRDMLVTKIDDGDALTVKGVDFGYKHTNITFTANAVVRQPVTIEIHLDSAKGPMVGRLSMKPTAGKFRNKTCKITGATGVHNLTFVFRTPHADPMDWDWWSMR